MEGIIYIPVKTNKVKNIIDEIILKARMKGYKITDKEIAGALTVVASLATQNAAYANNIADRISNAFWPLIDAMRALGVPLTYGFATFAALTMFFDQRKGMKILKNTAVAYLILNFLPELLRLLMDIGTAMHNGN